MKNPARFLSLLSLILLALIPAAARAQAPITTAERTDYAQTSTHAEVMAFVEHLAADFPTVTLDTLGTSTEGRDLPLLIIADPPIATAEQARDSGKLIALLLGNIHGGEVCGKEALLMLARELATDPDHPLLDDLIICIVPLYNADGNERMAPDNRPGQIGPDQMGTRTNAQGLDLNRDFIKAEAPETRALLRFFRTWNPDLFLDAHTTNGSYHRYPLTYAGPKHPGGDLPLLEYTRDHLLPRVAETLRQTKNLDTFPYGNFANDHTQWTTYPAAPRYSTNYAGMRNTIGILSEAYSYVPFEQRVLATLDFCRAVLEDVAAHRGEIAELRTAAADRAADSSSRKAPTPIRTRATALPGTRTALGYVEVEHDGRMIATDETAEYEVEVIDNFVGTLAIERPWAYLLPADREGIATHLQRHGLIVEIIREDVLLDAGVYTYDTIDRAEKPFQGHRMVTATTTLTTEPRSVMAGAYLARVDQPLGNLLVAMLEPAAEDSLVTWNFFDDTLEVGREYPILRLDSALPLLTAELPPLPEDRRPKKRLTYEALYESRDRPDFRGSPMRSVAWQDDEHYTVRRDGDTWLVEAATGRYIKKVEPDETAPIVEALAALPSIDDKTANRLGSRRSFVSTAGGIGVFRYQQDLYAVALDGSFARRLTAHPSREELVTLSPDGRYAAFVRDHDLYAVETATGTERRLTTTGSEKIRNGKHAWVYYEELFSRNWRAYWWAPDSSAIAFYETDSTAVDTFTLVDDALEPQEVRVTEYPKPGTPNPSVRLGIVSPAGGEPAFVDLADYTRGDFLLSSTGWWPDASRLSFTIQNRTQTWLDLCTVSPRGGTPTRLLRDATEAWIEAPSLFRVLSDGSFLLTSERSGWKHLYHYDKTGTLLTQVTDGPWEFRNLVRLDEKRREIFFTCTADSPLATTLYAVNLDGSNLRRLTPDRGSHRASLSPDGSYIVDTWSNAHTPDRTVLRDRNGKILRTLDTNPLFDLDTWERGTLELLRIPASRTDDDDNPVMLEAMFIYPPDFDPDRRYPVWFSTYAGPHAPTVRDTWAGGRAHDHMLAASGLLIFKADPYSASGKGARSAWTAYLRLGIPEMEDINDLMDWLKAQPFVDPDRIGMSGFSYGGFITAYAMTHSTHFARGIAGGSVTDWRDYDTIYTERYMRTPQNNPEGYAATSVVAAAKNLHGTLLLTHGWMDDNVHPQNSIKLIKALQDADKDFEMMFYPRFAHGIWSKHYRRLNYEFQMELVDQPKMENTEKNQPRSAREKPS